MSKMKQLVAFFCVGFVLIGCNQKDEKSGNRDLGESSAASVGLDDNHLAYIDSVMNLYHNDGRISGSVVLVARNGKTVKLDAYGQKNDSEQMQTDNLFRIASMTKAIVAVAAMSLLEEGKFNMDDPLWWYIPEFREMEILDKVNMADSTYTSYPATNEIKIKHLFNHTSGLGYGFQDDKLNALFFKHGISEGFEHRDILLKDNTAKLASLPLMHEPGEKWTYGVSYDVLGHLIEIWSGQTLDVFLHERIFGPLEMNDTHFYLPEEKEDRLVKVYMSSQEGYKETDYELIHYPVKGAKKYLSGGGDLSCTASDYAKFAQMVMDKGMFNGQRIVGPKTIEWMTAQQSNGGLEGIGWGFGVQETKNEMLSHTTPGSNSWGGFFSTHCLMDPSEELIVIVFMQMYPNWEWHLSQKVQNIVYSSIDR